MTYRIGINHANLTPFLMTPKAQRLARPVTTMATDTSGQDTGQMELAGSRGDSPTGNQITMPCICMAEGQAEDIGALLRTLSTKEDIKLAPFGMYHSF